MTTVFKSLETENVPSEEVDGTKMNRISDDELDYTRHKQQDGYISVRDFGYAEDDVLHSGFIDGVLQGITYRGTNDVMGTAENMSNANGLEDGDLDLSRNRQSFLLPSEFAVQQFAVALYDFEPENDNELELREGDTIYINYKHGQGWLVAENQARTKTGLVPEEFVSFVDQESPRPAHLARFLDNNEEPDEWEDVDGLAGIVETKLNL